MHADPDVRDDLIKKHVTEDDLNGLEGEGVPVCFGSHPQGNESAWAQGCKQCYLSVNSDACSKATEDVRERERARTKATRFVIDEVCDRCKGTGSLGADRWVRVCHECAGSGKKAKPCPKCKATSGNDWSQCKGDCPLPGTPHYKRYVFKTDERGPYILDREIDAPITIKIAVERLNGAKP